MSGAVCAQANGSGDFEKILASSLDGSVVTVTVSAQSVLWGGEYGTVTVTPLEGVQDLNPSNNSRTCRMPYRLMLPMTSRNGGQ